MANNGLRPKVIAILKLDESADKPKKLQTNRLAEYLL